MSVNIYNDYKNHEVDESRYAVIFSSILNILNKKGDYDLSLTLVDNKKIQEINRDYRSLDEVTDVISFAIMDDLEFEIIEGMEIDLGDIFISVDRANTQAEDLNQSLEKELEFLFVHGVLHLFGYDHMNKEDEEIMFDLQRKIINEINQWNNR